MEVDKASNNIVTRAGRKESLTSSYKSAITDHVVEKNHVIGWARANWHRQMQEMGKRTIDIRKRGGTTINRDEGQYLLSHI